MGVYVNPGNQGFREMLRSDYVDKTGMIALINETLETTRKLTCVSRPRRFGKTFAAKMLCAYYDYTCDSRSLFDSLEIAKSSDYLTFLNKYMVIYIDISGFTSMLRVENGSIENLLPTIQESIRKELLQTYPYLDESEPLPACMLRCVKEEDRKIVFIIDEWDAPIRESTDTSIHSAYLDLLRSWFKNSNLTPKVTAAAYMTGILPIRKDGSQSAISDFIEYPILYPDGYASYTGFTESDVRLLCDSFGCDFTAAKKWYDGYHFSGCESIYNPFSVMQAMHNRTFRSYWQKTSAAESLTAYINLDFDGLQDVTARLIAGEAIEVDADGFENDFTSFKNRDDVLTLLVHLGYLSYDEGSQTVRIPNLEVGMEFKKLLKSNSKNDNWVRLITQSRKLLEDTLSGDETAVAAGIDSVRCSEYAPTYYNDEQALRYVVKFAYIAGLDQYTRLEELPSGRGIADVVFLPKKHSALPALIVELKWNKSADGAIAQTKNRNYPAVLMDYGGEIILAGINYDEKRKQHKCKIERINR